MKKILDRRAECAYDLKREVLKELGFKELGLQAEVLSDNIEKIKDISERNKAREENARLIQNLAKYKVVKFQRENGEPEFQTVGFVREVSWETSSALWLENLCVKLRENDPEKFPEDIKFVKEVSKASGDPIVKMQKGILAITTPQAKVTL